MLLIHEVTVILSVTAAIVIFGDDPTLTVFDPVHEHPEEGQEIQPRENLEIPHSNPIQP